MLVPVERGSGAASSVAAVPRSGDDAPGDMGIFGARGDASDDPDRNANAWAVFGRRAHCSSVVTSSALSTSGDNFEDGMPQPKTLRAYL